MKKKLSIEMRRRAVAVCTLAAVVACTLFGCGKQDTGLSNEPGGGKWVDSDVDGFVTASDVIRPQDDFAASANQEWIVSVPFDPETGTTEDMSVGQLMVDRCNQLLEDESVTGANVDVLRTVRDLTLDWDERNRLGFEPLRPYIATIEDISSVDELTEYQGSIEDNPFGLGLLMPKKVEQQLVDVDKKILDIDPPEYSLGEKGAYLSFGTDALSAKEMNDELVTYFLEGLDYSKSEITDILKGNYRVETYLARHENEYSLGEELHQKQTTREGVSAFLNDYPLFDILDARGFEDCDSFYLDYMYLMSLKGIYNEDNLKDLKSFLIVHLIRNAQVYFDRESFEKSLELRVSQTDKNAKLEIPEDDVIAQSIIAKAGFAPAMDTVYLENYFPGDKKTERYTKMVEGLVESYREMLGEEDWLSDETKAAAIEKLDNMAIHVVKPDNTADYSDAKVRGYADGGTLLDAAAEGARMQERHKAEEASHIEADRYFWDIYDSEASTTQINCFYYPSKNAIYILAGWVAVADLLYGDDVTYEQFLGCVGSAAGHEISHGFDAQGSRFDKYGRRYNEDGSDVDWMTIDDRSHLDERADRVASYFSLVRPIPGKKKVDGQTVKNEAIADMGGIKAILYMAKKMPDFNYDEFFRGYAAVWRAKTTEENELLGMGDEHPLSYLRINITLQQYDEFLGTYDIKPDDGMYLEPERRINVW